MGSMPIWQWAVAISILTAARAPQRTYLWRNACKKICNGIRFFGLQLSRNLYRSFIVHELAHAIAANNFTIEHVSTASQEYIAYTVQLATMARSLQKSIFTTFTHEPFLNEGEITSLFYYLNPEVFGVKAYRHFQRLENGADFYRRILTGGFQPME